MTKLECQQLLWVEALIVRYQEETSSSARSGCSICKLTLLFHMYTSMICIDVIWHTGKICRLRSRSVLSGL